LWTTSCPVSVSGLSPACCWPSFLFSLCLLIVRMEISSFSSVVLVYCTLCCVLVFISLFIVQFCFVFFYRAGVSLPRGLCWFIIREAGDIPCYSWGSPVWSAKCLPSRFGTSVWWRQQPSDFLNVIWCGEVFYGLGVQGVEVLILLCALFLWLQHFSKVFDSQSSCCLLLYPSHHLVSS
jgi:hypothetical protein